MSVCYDCAPTGRVKVVRRGGGGVGVRRVLITGGYGLLGSALKEEFPEAIRLGRGLLDMTNRKDVLRLREVARGGLVLHCAALTDVDRCEHEPELAEAVNVEGTRNVLALGTPVVYFSTDYVFDGAEHVPYVEWDTPRPLSVYGRTKLAGEKLVLKAGGWVVRTSWLYGWAGRGDLIRYVLAAARAGEPVMLSGGLRIGSPTYAAHLAAAVRELVERCSPDMYHLAGSGEPCTRGGFARAVLDAAGIDGVICGAGEGALNSAPRPPYSALRSGRVGTPRLPDWRDGVREAIARTRD